MADLLEWYSFLGELLLKEQICLDEWFMHGALCVCCIDCKIKFSTFSKLLTNALKWLETRKLLLHTLLLKHSNDQHLFSKKTRRNHVYKTNECQINNRIIEIKICLRSNPLCFHNLTVSLQSRLRHNQETKANYSEESSSYSINISLCWRGILFQSILVVSSGETTTSHLKPVKLQLYQSNTLQASHNKQSHFPRLYNLCLVEFHGVKWACWWSGYEILINHSQRHTLLVYEYKVMMGKS